MKSSDEPAKSNAVVQNLEAVPRVSSGRDVDESQKDSGYDLQNEDCERRTTEKT